MGVTESYNSHRASVTANYNADPRLYGEHLGIETALADASLQKDRSVMCLLSTMKKNLERTMEKTCRNLFRHMYKNTMPNLSIKRVDASCFRIPPEMVMTSSLLSLTLVMTRPRKYYPQ